MRLQDTLSSVVSCGSDIDESMMQQIQQLDRISQQLSDLATLFSSCAMNFDDAPAAFGASIQSSTRLVEIRERVLGVDVGDTSNGDLDLF